MMQQQQQHSGSSAGLAARATQAISSGVGGVAVQQQQGSPSTGLVQQLPPRAHTLEVSPGGDDAVSQ